MKRKNMKTCENNSAKIKERKSFDFQCWGIFWIMHVCIKTCSPSTMFLQIETSVIQSVGPLIHTSLLLSCKSVCSKQVCMEACVCDECVCVKACVCIEAGVSKHVCNEQVCVEAHILFLSVWSCRSPKALYRSMHFFTPTFFRVCTN